MNDVNVKETIINGIGKKSFVKDQGADAKAAFQRVTITREMLENYSAKINATNTVDVAGDLKSLYNDLEVLAKAIIREELKLVEQGA